MLIVGMYPFPIRIGTAISRLLPAFSHTPIWLMKKTGSKAADWVQSMKLQVEQTTFWR